MFDPLSDCWKSLSSLEDASDDAVKLLSRSGLSSVTLVKWMSSSSGVESHDPASESGEVPVLSDESWMIVTSFST